MEQTKVPIVAKRIYNMVRVIYYMLRKGISKRKLTVDLIMMLKRGKIAGKAAINNLMFHHHHHHHSSAASSRHSRDEYEFSCSNSPVSSFVFPFHLTKRNKRQNDNQSHSFACADAPGTEDDILTARGVRKVLEMLNGEVASPALPGFGRSPAVRRLSITDSPLPLRDVGDVDGHAVDAAAEDFIVRFYSDLRKENATALC